MAAPTGRVFVHSLKKINLVRLCTGKVGEGARGCSTGSAAHSADDDRQTDIDSGLSDSSKMISENDRVVETFINRNPRNLEKMGMATKDYGWWASWPRRHYHHRLMFSQTNRNTTAWLENRAGDTLLTTSTQEWGIQRHLYSRVDASAAANVGHIMADRLLEVGLQSVYYHNYPHVHRTPEGQAFYNALWEGGLRLQEIKPRLFIKQTVAGEHIDFFPEYDHFEEK